MERSDPNCPALLDIYECRGDLSIIFDTQRAVAYRAARSGFNPISEAAIGFQDN
jgi:hypothetical protein